jgi:hypothetical protein
MIRPSTVVYILLLLVLVGAYYFLKNREKPAEIEATAEPTIQVSYLFTPEQGTPSMIQLESKSGNAVEIERGTDNAWALTRPVEAKAEQGAAEAAASQVTTLRILDKVPDVDPKIVGLEIPEYVLTVKFTGGAEQKIDIGVLTPSESGYYVRDAAGKIVIVSRDAVDALLGLLDHPPYLETLTPSPTVTESSMPLPATPVVSTPVTTTATP